MLIHTESEKLLVLEDKNYTEFSPVTAGMEKCVPEKSFGPSVRKYYLIHFIIKGSGSFINPKGEYTVSEGQAFLIRPDEICTYKTDSKNPWTYMWIGFNGRLAERFDNIPDVFEYDRGFADELSASFELRGGAEEYLTGMLFKLYAELFGSRIKNDYISRITGFINANYMQDITVSGIADMLSVSRKYLARIFKEQTGTTMKQYLIKKRLKEAKRLLESGFTVEEAGMMTGYPDSFTFSKAFKKIYGKPPVYYKKP